MLKAALTDIAILKAAGYRVEREPDVLGNPVGPGWLLLDPEGAQLMIGRHGHVSPTQWEAVAEGLSRIAADAACTPAGASAAEAAGWMLETKQPGASEWERGRVYSDQAALFRALVFAGVPGADLGRGCWRCPVTREAYRWRRESLTDRDARLSAEHENALHLERERWCPVCVTDGPTRPVGVDG